MPSTLKKTLSVAALFVVAGALSNPLWTDEKGTADALINAGYTPNTVGGYTWANCGGADLWRTKFTATNSSGEDTSGIVCKGLFKGPTIHFN